MNSYNSREEADRAVNKYKHKYGIDVCIAEETYETNNPIVVSSTDVMIEQQP